MADKIGENADAHAIEQPPLALMGGVQHRAMKARAGEAGQNAKVRVEIGEQHGDEANARRQRGQFVDDLLRVGRQRQREFDEFDPGRGGGLYRRARMGNVVRQFDHRADGTPAVDGGDDAGDIAERQGAQRPARRILAVHDVGAPLDGDFRLGAGKDAGQHRSHRLRSWKREKGRVYCRRA